MARRLAHEIKNPLTPIQLSAERLQRHFAGAPEATRRARRRVRHDDRDRSGIAERAGRRVRPVRADAGAAGDAQPICMGCWTMRWRSIAGCSATSRSGRIRGVAAQSVGGSGADSPRHHQHRGQRDRGGRTPRRRSTSRRSTTPGTAWSGSSWRTTGRAFRQPSATSCFCRITRPSSGAAGSAWRSSGASSPSMAAVSMSATTFRAGHGLRSSYLASSSPFPVLVSRFVFMFSSVFWCSMFEWSRPSWCRTTNLEPRTLHRT